MITEYSRTHVSTKGRLYRDWNKRGNKAMITKDIERKLAKLAALEDAGVESWRGYDFALEEYRSTIKREEIAEQLVKDIFESLMSYIEEPAGKGCGYAMKAEGYELAVEMILKRVKGFKP
jgi:hypothetical protein